MKKIYIVTAITGNWELQTRIVRAYKTQAAAEAFGTRCTERAWELALAYSSFLSNDRAHEYVTPPGRDYDKGLLHYDARHTTYHIAVVPFSGF